MQNIIPDEFLENKQIEAKAHTLFEESKRLVREKPLVQKNSDSGKEFNDPNGRSSKDDTIFDDFEDEEWLWQSDEGGAAVDPDDPLGLMAEPETESSTTTENAPTLIGTMWCLLMMEK